MIIVRDFKGRELSLLSRIARKTNGHRYITRKSVANLLLGKSTRVVGGSDDTNPKKYWPASFSNTRIRFGCHVFEGENASAIKTWALS